MADEQTTILGSEDTTQAPAVTEAPATDPAAEAPAVTEVPAGGDAEAKPEGEAEADKDADGKAKDPEKDKADGAPEAYEPFKVPDGMEMDQERLEAFVPVAKELNLSQEKTQKLIDFYAGVQQKLVVEQHEEWARTKAGWVAAAKADKEIGGDAFEENVGYARKAMEAVGTPALKEALNVLGAGDHPEVIRAFAKMGRLMTAHKFVFGKGQDASQPKTTAQILFPDLK